MIASEAKKLRAIATVNRSSLRPRPLKAAVGVIYCILKL